MKVAFIGNMNNNGFALMRYFRDLGADAHLLLFKDDGVGSHSHFNTDADTWNPAHWAPFIRRLPFRNGPGDLVGRPESLMPALWPLAAAKTAWCALTRGARGQPHTTSGSVVRDALAPFDVLIGSGLSPAYAALADRRLTAYFPYSIGVEFVGSPLWTHRPFSWMPHIRRMKQLVTEAQSEGVRRSLAVFNSEMGLTDQILHGLDVKPVRLQIPMVYNREPTPSWDAASEPVRAALYETRSHDLNVFHHTRLNWVRPASMPVPAWRHNNKNNDWVFHAFAELVRLRPQKKIRLLACRYGCDVSETECLARSLGIEKHVRWLPVLQRKEISLLLRASHVAIGEFMIARGCLWGGCTWESLAAGCPIIQGFNFDQGVYAETYGHAEPPLLKVTARPQILDHLLRAADDPKSLVAVGSNAFNWFNANNGIGLASRWLDAISRCSTAQGRT